MASVVLMKKNEIAIPEGQKGKQIAVKENNIIALKEFYKNNYQTPQLEKEPQVEEPSLNQEPLNFDAILNSSAEEPVFNPINPMDKIENNNFIEESNPVQNAVIPEEVPIEPVSIIDNSIPQMETSEVNMPSEETETGTDDTSAIKLVLENPEAEKNEKPEEEMDPELKEIKERLDKVIQDLNNYKKKIKILEDEVNRNLEKSREVLKDTQAAAEIMSIQQKRQQQITDEIATGGTIVNDAQRILQKDAA